jgi:hypothetical protein
MNRREIGARGFLWRKGIVVGGGNCGQLRVVGLEV